MCHRYRMLGHPSLRHMLFAEMCSQPLCLALEMAVQKGDCHPTLYHAKCP